MSPTPLMHIDDLADDASKGLQADGVSYFAVKRNGQLYLYLNRCPHLGIELNWQEDRFLDPDNTLIQCATHGALFIIDTGECISGPCLGQSLTPVPFTVEAGQVWLAPGPAGAE